MLSWRDLLCIECYILAVFSGQVLSLLQTYFDNVKGPFSGVVLGAVRASWQWAFSRQCEVLSGFAQTPSKKQTDLRFT